MGPQDALLVLAVPVELAAQPQVHMQALQILSEDIAKITSTTAFDWGLSDAKFKAAIEDATQSLMTGGYSVEQFIKDVSKAIPQTK